jgi:hypothetical protein
MYPAISIQNDVKVVKDWLKDFVAKNVTIRK